MDGLEGEEKPKYLIGWINPDTKQMTWTFRDFEEAQSWMHEFTPTGPAVLIPQTVPQGFIVDVLKVMTEYYNELAIPDGRVH